MALPCARYGAVEVISFEASQQICEEGIIIITDNVNEQ